jgi:hypothetical protein
MYQKKFTNHECSFHIYALSNNIVLANLNLVLYKILQLIEIALIKTK